MTFEIIDFKLLYALIYNTVSYYINNGKIEIPVYIPLHKEQSVVEHITYETIARLFVLSFDKYGKNSTGANNIRNNINKYYKEKLEDNFVDSFEAIEKMARRDEEKKRAIHKKDMGRLRSMGIEVPEENTIKSLKEGRIYDAPNLILLTERAKYMGGTFYELLTKNRLTNSKKTSHEDFADAYKDLELKYDRVRECIDKLEYIYGWVDLHRMETNFHASLISEMAEYMCTHDDVFFDEYSTSFWCSARINDVACEAYQILRYEKYIDYYEQKCQNEKSYLVLEERFELSKMLSYTMPHAMRFFELFHSGDEDVINDMYEFCHDKYPIVETHKPSLFYNKDGTLKRKKIRCARKIIDHLLRPDLLFGKDE